MDEGVDELVFYDITAAVTGELLISWVNKVARDQHSVCVAGGIRSIEDAKVILNNGADKISINSPPWNAPNSSPNWPKILARSVLLLE